MLVVIDETLYVSYGSDVRTVINLVDEHIGRFHFNSLLKYFCYVWTGPLVHSLLRQYWTSQFRPFLRRTKWDLPSDDLNRVWQQNIFRDSYPRLYFHPKNIELWYDFCEECNQTAFLTEFSRYDTSGYCLAVLFTHRDFPHGIQGLAWRNTVCEKR